MEQNSLLKRLVAAVQALAWSIAIGAAQLHAEPAVVRNFDGPQTTWLLADPRPSVRVVAHGCVTDDAREGAGSERIVISAPAGESAYVASPVGRLPVLDELLCRIWVKANRPGITLVARVVLPRSLDPTTRAPRLLMVQGTQSQQVGQWQQLSLSNMPKLTADEVRILRAAIRTEIDAREAYVDTVLLALPGGPGTTEVWTDALEIEGVVIAPQIAPSNSLAAADTTERSGPRSPIPGWRQNTAPGASGDAVIAKSSIELRGTTLFVAGKPFLSRGIQWNGESLSHLASHGLNTVWLNEAPTPEQWNEAVRSDVWFICTPPRPDTIAASGLGESLDRVLAWSLPSPADPNELDYTRRWADMIRQRDSLSRRPIVMAPQADWLPCSKFADVLVADHLASTGLDAGEYAVWFKNLALVARPGTLFWACIPTQPGPRAREQAAALLPSATSSTIVSERQLEMLARTAAIQGSRGFLFQSDSPLDADDDVSKRRAMLVESVNRELQLIEPWLTLGKLAGQCGSGDASNEAMVLQVERARLLVPNAWSKATDAAVSLAPSSVTNRNTSLVVPGVPESNDAFLLMPAGLRPLTAKRVTGGVSVALKGDENGLIVLTDDPNVATSLRQRIARSGERSTILERNLASARAQSLAATARRLKQLGQETADFDQALAAAGAHITRCNALMSTHNLEAAYQSAAAARQSLADTVDRKQQTLSGPRVHTSDPFGAKFDMFLQQVEFQKKVATLRGAENQLDGGSFEDLGQLKNSGWQHVSDPIAGIIARAELSTRDPHDGQYCLELSAAAEPGSVAPHVIARPPVWITSPTVHADEGQLLEITGWVRISNPITGGIDGLAIVDSLGGPELALRVPVSPYWQQFRMIRGVTQATDVTTRFALAGLGTASIDDVAVRELVPPTVRRLPDVTSDGPSFPHAAQRTKELFTPPPRSDGSSLR